MILSGVLEGNENPGPYNPVLYIANLQMSIRIDICSVKWQTNGEDKFCTMNVNGSGVVKTEQEGLYQD